MRRLLLSAIVVAACAPASPMMRGGASAEARDPERARRAFGAIADGNLGAAAALEAAVREAPSPAGLYARALVEQERGDLAAAQDLYLAALEAGVADKRCVDADGCGGPLWPRVALAAVRRLETLAGEAPFERDRDVAGRIGKLDGARLPTEVRRRWILLRATYARRAEAEAEARRLEREAGCPSTWWVAGPYGRLPRLDLFTPFEPEKGSTEWRSAPARGCSVVVTGPRGRSGVVYAANDVKLARDGAIVVTVETEAPWRLFVDGVAVAGGVEEATAPPRVRQTRVALSSGTHRVMVKIAAPGGRADVALSIFGAGASVELLEPAASARGDRSAAEVERARGSGAKPPRLIDDPSVALRGASDEAPGAGALDDVLALEAAVAFSDSAALERRAARIAARWPKFAIGHLLQAQAALLDPTRPVEIAQDRARAAVERALALDPRLARARNLRVQMAMAQERPREALARLDEAPAGGPRYWRFAFARYQAYRARGWSREAEEALAEAKRMHPDACPLFEAEIQVKRERHDVAGARAAATKAAHCGGGSDELADELREAHDLDGAIAEYRRLVELDPTRDSWKSGLAETLAMRGDAASLREAASLFGELVARDPRATHARRQLADVKIALGDVAGARRVVEEGLAETPESTELYRALEALCDRDATTVKSCGGIEPWRVDGHAVIAEYEKRGGSSWRSPAVIVLDRTVTRVYPTGARLTLTHNIIQVLAKDGLDKFGEVKIPDGADVLLLRTVKRDGSTREPEDIAGKDSVSVPDLEVGDYVEFEYVDPSSAPAAFPGGFLSERFYFRSFDAPLDRSEYVVVTPQSMALQIDARGDAPQPTVERKEGLAVRTFAMTKMAQVIAEPQSTPYAEWIPSVRVAAGLSMEGWRDFLRDGHLMAERANPQLTEIALRETRGLVSVEDKARALDRWVRRAITKSGGSIDDPATFTLARGEGNRTTLLAALCRAAGVPAEIWLARSAQAPRLDGTLPDLEAFDQPVLAVGRGAGKPPLFIDPRFRHGPAGFLVWPLRGQPALVLREGALKTETIAAASDDDRLVDMEARLEPSGAAEVSIVEKLRGAAALDWREALEKLPADRVRPEFEVRTLARLFPGSTLRELSWENADADDEVFIVKYKFQVAQLARRVKGALVLPAPFPAMLGRNYVGVGARKTPLFVDQATPSKLIGRFVLPPKTEARLAPKVELSGFGSLVQSIVREGDVLRFESLFTLPHQRIAPADYPKFVDYTTALDRAESRIAELSVAK
jgi:tetratricopeptide (TPR) repeat protein